LNKYVVTVERIVFENCWCLGQFEGILMGCFTKITKKKYYGSQAKVSEVRNETPVDMAQ
jgi:hypothetical protein